MGEARALDGVVLTVDGRSLAPDQYPLLRRVRVEESVLLPDAFTLAFDDPHFELFDRDLFTVGTRIEIAFRADSGPVLVTAGEVTTISVEQGVSGRHDLVVGGLDLAHRLAREVRVRTFQRVTDADIASRIAADHGLEADVETTSVTHQHLSQVQETDFAFLRRRAWAVGFDLWITERTLHFRRRPAARGEPPQLRWGENLTRFSVRYSATERCDEVRVRAWDPLGKSEIDGSADDGDLGTTAPAAGQFATGARRAFGRTVRRAGQFPVADGMAADALASSLLARASGSEVLVRGETRGDPRLGAGTEVRLDGVGTRLAGDYRVTSVEHVFSPGTPYVTRFVCGGKEPAGLADLMGVGSVPGTSTGRGSASIGLVTNNDDPERLGRVKVRLPAAFEHDESDWARVVSPGAGAARGLQWIPELDDEVLVVFEAGDPGRPLVLGGLWNRKDAPPQADAVSGGSVRARFLVSRGDQRLVLTDEPEPAVELSLGDGSCVLHLESSESTVSGDRKLVLSAENVEVRARATLKLQGRDVQIAAEGGDVKVTGTRITLN